MKSLIIILLSVLMSLSVHAKPIDMAQLEAAGLIIKQGTAIEIQSYDAKSKTYELAILKEPGVGPNITTGANLSKATGIPEGELKERHGSEIILKKPLILVPENQEN